jgi:hypothetical protein
MKPSAQKPKRPFEEDLAKLIMALRDKFIKRNYLSLESSRTGHAIHRTNPFKLPK